MGVACSATGGGGRRRQRSVRSARKVKPRWGCAAERWGAELLRAASRVCVQGEPRRGGAGRTSGSVGDAAPSA
eukprot:13102-Prymnesium_polylepis.1